MVIMLRAEEEQRTAEESHGAAGEVEEVAEREIVFAALDSSRGDVGVGVDVGRGEGEEESECRAEGADRDQQPEVPAEGAAASWLEDRA
jgi:hypothetical protein